MIAAAGEIPGEVAADEAVFEAPALLRILWADPQHMAEHIALWSLTHLGPRARAAVAKLRSQHPDAGRGELEGLVIGQQARTAMTEGAFVGGPFIALIPVAFCASLLAQAQMVFDLAALGGREPRDQMRVADLLVLLGAYDSAEEANSGLAAVPRDAKQHRGKKLPPGTRWTMVRRMAYLLEVLGPAEENRSRLRAVLGWAGVTALSWPGSSSRSSSAPPWRPSTTTPSPNTKTTAGSCSPRCSPESTRTPHEPHTTAPGPPRPPPRTATGDDSLAVLNQAIDDLARLRTPCWLGDSAVRLHTLGSLIAQAEQLLPRAVHEARDQELTWPQVGELLAPPQPPRPRRYRSKP